MEPEIAPREGPKWALTWWKWPESRSGWQTCGSLVFFATVCPCRLRTIGRVGGLTIGDKKMSFFFFLFFLPFFWIISNYAGKVYFLGQKAGRPKKSSAAFARRQKSSIFIFNFFSFFEKPENFLAPVDHARVDLNFWIFCGCQMGVTGSLGGQLNAALFLGVRIRSLLQIIRCSYAGCSETQNIEKCQNRRKVESLVCFGSSSLTLVFSAGFDLQGAVFHRSRRAFMDFRLFLPRIRCLSERLEDKTLEIMAVGGLPP